MWWLWVLGGLAAWTVLAFAVAVVVGRGVRLADRWSPGTGEGAPLTTAALATAPATRVAEPRVRRRAIPLPPVGIALVATAVALETAGYITRLNGSTGTTARLLSMDAPFSMPRLFVAAVFAAAALAAVAGAGALEGRRTWWLAVGLVGGVVAAVKAGSTVHADALNALSRAVGGYAALAISAGVVLAVVGTLAFLTRTERRDRRRVLSVLALYGVAAVGLSAVSSVVSDAYGWASSWAAAATFVEESGEALAGVAFLMAVLAGVAPRVVLPASWALRREIDAQTLDLPEQVPGRSAIRGSNS